MQSPKFKVTICGGGVAGLTFAVAMARFPNIEVEMFESAAAFSPIGAGIGVWPRVWDALTSIGLADLEATASRKPSRDTTHTLVFRKSDRKDGYRFHDLYSQGPLLFFHRADFQGGLLKHIPPTCKISYSKRFVSYKRLPSGKIEVAFKDGTTTTCDLLLGADGIKSAIRAATLRELADKATAEGRHAEAENLMTVTKPIWTGTVAYRALVPVDKIENFTPREHGVEYLGKNWAIIFYPVANGTMLNLAAYSTNYDLAGTTFPGSWIEEVDKEKFIDSLSHWEPEFLNLIKAMNKPKRWAIHTVEGLPTFVSDGIALVGDAAHAMAPHQGSGAGQAIEDVCLLAELLGHESATLETLPEVLRIYDTLRRPFAQDIGRRSYQTGRYLSHNHEDFTLPEGDPVAEEKVLKQLGQAVQDNWQWAWTTSLADMTNEGIRMLESSTQKAV